MNDGSNFLFGTIFGFLAMGFMICMIFNVIENGCEEENNVYDCQFASPLYVPAPHTEEKE